jgi:predicted branched-subunit amino acid permease
MSSPHRDTSETRSASAAGFVAGLRTAATSVFTVVLIGTYVSIGALGQNFGFSLLWVVLSTLLVWAGPAQVLIITALGAGAPPLEVALAVGLSGLRLMPMVVALLPLLKTPATRSRDLVLPAHYTAASMWVEALRLTPRMPRDARIGFVNGIGSGFMAAAVASSIAGFFLAGRLPTLLAGALLFLTPISFLVSTIRNSRQLADRVALILGLALAPLLTLANVGLDLMWTGLIGGTIGYAAYRLREILR